MVATIGRVMEGCYTSKGSWRLFNLSWAGGKGIPAVRRYIHRLGSLKFAGCFSDRISFLC